MPCLLQKQCYTLQDAFQIHSKNPNKLLPISNSHNIQEHIYLKELKSILEKKVELAKRKRFLQSSNTRSKFTNHINSMCEIEISHTLKMMR
jgi:t-SNARE complex subunit (syntaxin)